MHSHTDYRPAAVGKRRTSGLTLLELVVVLAVLVVLAGMLVPIISGLGYQTNAATNATVVDEVTRSVRTYHARFDVQPDRWDSLLTSDGTLFSKLHPGLVGGSPSDAGRAVVSSAPLALEPHQVTSLTQAGIHSLYYADAAGQANAAHTIARTVAVGEQVARLSDSAGAARIRAEALAVAQSNPVWEPNATSKFDFIVLGLGPNSALRGTVATEVPLIQSADPLNYYARVLCIYMVPSETSTDTFPAVFLGCILPDGTSRNDNLESYNNTRSESG